MSRERELGRRLKRATREHHAAVGLHDRMVARFLGINETDLGFLDLLDRTGRMTPGQLALESGLTTGAVTAVLDRLEAMAYVRRVRDRDDRRRIWIELSDTSRTILAPLYQHYGALGGAITARFSPSDIATVIAYLDIGSDINRTFASLLEAEILEADDPVLRAKRARAWLKKSEAAIRTLCADIAAGTPPHGEG